MTKVIYNDNLIVKDALQHYFSKYHFKNGGYDLKWFKIKLGFIYIPLPNIKDRVDAVKIHDIHHLITEYEANLRGEAQIAGWELASGCGRYYMAWILNMGSFFYGMFFFPVSLFKAFMLGKKVKTNFYYNTIYNDALLNHTVGNLRARIRSNAKSGSVFSDYLCFTLWCMFVLSLSVLFFGSIYMLCSTI